MKIRRITLLVIMLSVITAACGRNDSSPTATFKAFFEAAKNNDIESMKKRVSEDYKRSFATADREMKQPEDEMFRITARSYAGLGAMPEVRNEKIEGDKASLEFKVEMTGEWKTLKFVSESGKWKVD